MIDFSNLLINYFSESSQRSSPILPFEKNLGSLFLLFVFTLVSLESLSDISKERENFLVLWLRWNFLKIVTFSGDIRRCQEFRKLDSSSTFAARASPLLTK